MDLIRDSLFSIQVQQPWLLLQFDDSNIEEIGEDRVNKILSVSQMKTKAKIGKKRSRQRLKTMTMRISVLPRP